MSDHNLVVAELEFKYQRIYSMKMINKKKVYRDNLEFNIFQPRTDQNKFLSPSRVEDYDFDLEKFQIINENTIK
jgi:hypothetical protein